MPSALPTRAVAAETRPPALQEEQIVDREPVAQVQAVVFSVLCSLLQRCAVLQLLHGQPNQQALTHGGAQRVDRQNLPLG